MRLARVPVIIAVFICCGCAMLVTGCTTAWISAYFREQERKEAYRPQVRDATSAAQPLQNLRAIRVRALAARSFRRVTQDWEREVSSQFDAANRIIAPLQARFALAAVLPWEYEGGAVLGDDLTRLRGEVDLRDVDLVVGFVAPLASVTDSLDHLGQAEIVGKLVVTRGFDDRAELLAFQRTMQLSSSAEVEALYLQRREHKKAVILVHEWGHTVGLTHDPDFTASIMRPTYDAQMSDLSPRDYQIAQLALASRVGPQGDEQGWRERLQAYLEAEPDLPPEQALVLQRLQGERARPRAASSGSGIDPHDRAILQQVNEALDDGRAEEAWSTLAEVRERYRDDPEVAILACRVAAGAKVRLTKEVCELARAIAADDPRPAFTLFLYRTPQYGISEKELALLEEACVRATASDAPAGDWLGPLAETAAVTGALSCATALLPRVPDAAQAERIGLRVRQARNQFGLVAAQPLALSDELALVALTVRVEELMAAGNLQDAETLVTPAIERWASAGAFSLQAEIAGRFKRYDVAKTLCQSAIKILPSDARAAYVLAVLDLHALKNANATARLVKNTTEAPMHEPSWLLLAQVLKASGQAAKLKALKQRYRTEVGREPGF